MEDLELLKLEVIQRLKNERPGLSDLIYELSAIDILKKMLLESGEEPKGKIKLVQGKSMFTEEELTPSVPINLVVRTYKSKV